MYHCLIPLLHGSVYDSTTVSTCGRDTCETYITPVMCPSATIAVTVHADNGFGQRLLSDPITIGMLYITS